MTPQIGDRVELTEYAMTLDYVKRRWSYTDVCVRKKGTIICNTTTGKYGIQFDTPVFLINLIPGGTSSHNNGCHGRGRINYCWYFPSIAFRVIPNNLLTTKETYSANLLLLL